MDYLDQSASVIRTKSFRPPVTTDLIRQEELLDRLEQGLTHRLTLVSAPAGYGKSTLVSSWLEDSAQPSAWLSVDERDNDLYQFLKYFIYSIRTLFPDACSQCVTFLQADNKPKNTLLITQMINDLEEIRQPFTFALDDYHLINNSEIHELLNDIIQFPGRTIHLVIITRRNPPFSLGNLRAKNFITEIRIQDLEFTPAQSAMFMHKACSKELNENYLQRLHDQLEGWPAGFRLVVLALQRNKDPETFIQGFATGNHVVQDYLINEVVNTQSPNMQNWLQKISILNRFCAPLCEAVCRNNTNGTKQQPFDGQEFLRVLENSGLFCIALDDKHNWYRYHHLFQTLQKNQLANNFSRIEIYKLHHKAAIWFEDQCMFDEAMDHYLKTNKPLLAGDMLSRARQQLTNEERWEEINRWLKKLPSNVIKDNLDLLILQARSLNKKGHYAEWKKVCTRIEDKLGADEPVTPQQRLHHGELAMMQGALFYHGGNGKYGASYTKRALQLLAPEAISERVFAILMHAASLQMTGDLQGAYNITYDALESDANQSPTLHARLLQTLCFLNWMSANLPEMEKAATTMLELGCRNSLAETIVFARYFRGVVHYQNNQLAEAVEVLTPVTENPYGPSCFMHVMSVQIVCLIHEIQGRHEEAQAISARLEENILEMGGGTYLPHAQALQAELALRQGRHSEATHWAEEFVIGETTAGYTFIIPALIAVKIFLSDESANALNLANKVLLANQQFFSSTHNDHFHAQVLALQAVLFELKGEQQKATSKITEALVLTQPGGDIRLYVDLGHQLVPLLNRVNLDAEGLRYVGRILSVFQHDSTLILEDKNNVMTSPVKWESLITPLSKREQEILQLLSDNLTNKEIAEKLFISPKTVKRHAERIYAKLGVHRRQEAIAKAIGLGIFKT